VPAKEAKNGDQKALSPRGDNAAKELTKEIAEATGTGVKSIQQIGMLEKNAPELA
jgi:hypothetical protein